MKLSEAVNNALNDLELVGNKRFIDLMTALYERMEIVPDLEEGCMPDVFEAINDRQSAIGEFVPVR